MPNCSAPGCSKFALGGTGLCVKHGGKVPVSSKAAYSVVLARAQGATQPDAGFASLAASRSKGSNWADWIDSVRDSGPSLGQKEMVHGVSCLHDTQKANNLTIWYNWDGSTMTVYGVGNHRGGSGAGNDQYEMTWFDGKSKTWSRPKKKK